MRNARSARICAHCATSITSMIRLGIVGREDIEDVVSRWTGVPVTSIKEEDAETVAR